MPIFSNVDGIWREVKNIYDNVGGVWKTTRAVHDNVDGAWRESYRKNMLEDYITPYVANAEYLQGTQINENQTTQLLTQISGVSTGGDTKPIQIGWLINNIPPGAKVTIEWEFMKDNWAMNDAIITSNHQNVTAETGNFTRKRSQYYVSGSMLIFINFWTTGQTTSTMKIYHISINDKVIYPVQQN